MARKKQRIEYLFIGNTYLSIQRAKNRKAELLNLGYKIIKENDKKITFIK